MQKSIRPQRARSIQVLEVSESDSARLYQDRVAIEEPCEIRIVHGLPDVRKTESLSITMRTPGNDHELAAGLLCAEGILDSRQQVESIELEVVDSNGIVAENVVVVSVVPGISIEIGHLQRNFLVNSSCGLCGKKSLESLPPRSDRKKIEIDFELDASMIHVLPEKLRRGQSLFRKTGGVHAAGIFNEQGEQLLVREDIGRHNALDKVVGTLFLEDKIPASEAILVVSGRASFEILQKADAGGFPVVVAVGAPSSLAVELAEHFGITLVGFAGKKRFNVYTNRERIRFR